MPPYTFPRNLRDLLRIEPRLDPDRVARLLADVAAVLAPRHLQGEAHGGLTPERVLLDADGRATLAAPPADDGGALAPWPAYLAPEQIDGREPDPASDVYTLGLLGWEMLAGQPPWAGESLYAIVLKQREQDLPRLSTLRPGLPRPLVVAIEGALHKSPGDRWDGADEMLAQLRAESVPDHPPHADYRHAAVTAGAPVVAAPAVTGPHVVEPRDAPRDAPRRAPLRPTVGMPAVPPPAPRARPSRLRPLGLAALAVAVLGAGAAGLAVFQGSDEKGSTRAWLDSVSAGGATGEVVAESTLTVAEERERDRLRRDSLARVARAAARRDSIRAAAAAADSAAAVPGQDTATPADSAPPPDTTAPPPSTPATPPPAAPPVAPPVAPPAAAARGDACATPDTPSQRSCLLALLARGDGRLNRAYAARIASLRRAAGVGAGAPDPPAVEALRAEQRAWLTQRDVECQRRGAGSEGPLWAESRARCLVALGERRASALGGAD